jgi:RNA polymerase sigma-70 factor (ECF subfamily)
MAGRGRPNREERRLAKRLRRRDPDVLSDLYARHGAQSFGYLMGVLRDRSAAEDVQQQVYLEVWERGERFDPTRGSLTTWIMTITRSRAIDHLRRSVPEPRDPDTLPEIGVPPAESALLDRWQMTALLRRLPAEEADVLRRRFYGQRSQREIADETGLALGTVKMRMVSGLRRLRDLLEDEGA